MKQKKHRNLIMGGICIVLLAITMTLFLNSYSIEERVKSISFTSSMLDYSKEEPGSVHVDKSAEWIAINQARITFDVDTVRKNGNPNMDIILVLDISSSMYGNSLDRVKEDLIDLIEIVLSEPNNQMALITFETYSQIVSGFTNNKEELSNSINSLVAVGNTNYYQALVNVDTILKDYQKEKDRNCVVLFLTDSYPNENTPNQIGQYQYLKKQYPYLNINSIQYEMGDTILEPIKAISDNQYIASMQTLYDTLLEASVISVPYDEFILTDIIDDNYFEVVSADNIHPSIGSVELVEENGKQKVRWAIDKFPSGKKATLTIDVNLKNEFKNQEGVYPTNQEESLIYQIGDIEEKITSTKTPKLQSYYQVSYDGNFPAGCATNNVPEASRELVKDSVEISNLRPSCEGYQFAGWKIVTKDTYQISDDSFEMPERNVLLRAEWSKLTLAKSMDGEVYVVMPPIIKSVGVESYSGELWKYKSSITKVIFQDIIHSIMNEQESWDISEAEDGSVIGRLVSNEDDPSTYTVYIQGDGGVIANSNSSYLFSNFGKLKTIEGLEYLDTSNVTNMSLMFCYCKALTSLNVSNFDTSNVTNMMWMFHDCRALTSLDVSNFDTSKVTEMNNMFYNCQSLTSLDLSNFDTSNVTNMSLMFNECVALTSLNVSNFDTSNVTDMCSMFYHCRALTSIDVSNFDTSNVTNMGGMFSYCQSLTSLDVSNFDTSKVTDMSGMFSNCQSLTSLDVSNFDTSKVTEMNAMFYDCQSLTSLDVSNFDTSNVTNMMWMFLNCNRLTATINITYHDDLAVYQMFDSAATIDNAKIIVNYTADASSLVDEMIATASSNSNVVKGSLIA